jgi:predicted nucleic acid-binding protein
MIEKVFFDTNLFIYAYTINEPEKTDIIRAFFQEFSAKKIVVISTQVLSEFYAVMAKHRYPHEKIVNYLNELVSVSTVNAITVQTISKAIFLKGKYKYSWWDSLILSSALESDCRRVYSEDMQHGQIIEEALLIENPLQSGFSYHYI